MNRPSKVPTWSPGISRPAACRPVAPALRAIWKAGKPYSGGAGCKLYGSQLWGSIGGHSLGRQFGHLG
eukprot:6568940-Alexandrium_andersonii.AAC.1